MLAVPQACNQPAIRLGVFGPTPFPRSGRPPRIRLEFCASKYQLKVLLWFCSHCHLYYRRGILLTLSVIRLSMGVGSRQGQWCPVRKPHPRAHPMIELAFKVLDALLPAFFNRRRLRVRVHRAVFVGSGQECFFVNLTNLSSTRELEVTHVWFQTDRQIPVMQPKRPLPVRLKPDQTWETWLPVVDVPEDFVPQALTLARARLSSGAVIASKPNTNVPDSGEVPGGNPRA